MIGNLPDYWRRQGLNLGDGCHPDSIREFADHNQVVLPTEVERYFRLVDGMRGAAEPRDTNGFSFWPLAELIPVNEEVENHTPLLHHFTGDCDFFVFADYMEWSWAYAVRLRGKQLGRVILIGRDTPQIVAESFGEFIAAYIEDRTELYDGVPVDNP